MSDASQERGVMSREDVRACLDRPAQSGSFKCRVVRDDGVEETQTCSLAVGLGSHHFAGEYAATFGVRAPAWVNDIHPWHRWELCRRAVEDNVLLPEARPGPLGPGA